LPVWAVIERFLSYGEIAEIGFLLHFDSFVLKIKPTRPGGFILSSINLDPLDS